MFEARKSVCQYARVGEHSKKPECDECRDLPCRQLRHLIPDLGVVRPRNFRNHKRENDDDYRKGTSDFDEAAEIRFFVKFMTHNRECVGGFFCAQSLKDCGKVFFGRFGHRPTESKRSANESGISVLDPPARTNHSVLNAIAKISSGSPRKIERVRTVSGAPVACVA
ncbi:unannotated protein [freshwater metagenome]|uniref:Unannotated protein n=1 Tax=freshwater metagenome TaxID=449393 RepID=A0A6J7VL31_9ZZZZ